MKKLKIIQIALLLFGVLTFAACSDDDEEDNMDDPMTMTDVCDDHVATYDGDVKEVINNSCAYSGCHNADNDFGLADYSTFDKLMAILDNDKFEERVLTAKNMPPASLVPEGRPAELTAEQLELLTCWKDAGFPES